MKLKFTALLLCLCTLTGCLSACTGGGSSTDSSGDSHTSESVTDPDTAATDEAADGETDPDTLPDSETTESETDEGETAPVRNEAEVERMNAMLADTYTGRELPIGGWSTPHTSLREIYSGVEGSYDRAYRLLADSGINYMITLEEWSSQTWPLESLSSAKQAGIKLWYYCTGQAADYSIEKINALLASEDADALAAIYVKDEPSLEQIPEVAENTAAIRAALSEADVSLPVLSNLLPTYATTAMVGTDYRAYVRTYLDAVKPDRLMFDYYPYNSGTSDTIPAMLANIAIAREEADRDGIELYTFLQSSGHTGRREPNVEELRCNAHLNLAMGVQGFAYFLTCKQHDTEEFTYMIDEQGQTTPLYDKVKTVNEELAAFRGVFLDYNYKGILVASYDAVNDQMERSGCAGQVLDTFGSLQKVKTLRQSKSIVGCFEDAEGREAYYVVNAEYTHKNTVTLTFDEAQSFVIWSKDGATLVENTATLELELASGDAAFVVKFDVNS